MFLFTVGFAPAVVQAAQHKAELTQAVAVIRPTQDHDVHGVVRFTETGQGVQIEANIAGLTPGQKHGFHIHTFGEATADDGTSAGGHFNPTGDPHGRPGDDQRHVGDMGNLHANENGFAEYERIDQHISLLGDHSVLGRAVIVHAKPDTFVQPTGAAGPRAAIGVIGRSRTRVIPVNLSEFKIDMPKSLPAGPTAFAVVNSGNKDHNFEIERGEFETEFDANLEPGEADVLEVNLSPGTYEIYCPVGDHEQEGMQLELRVEKR
jgi:Cu-Zn family superoxide dismutase